MATKITKWLTIKFNKTLVELLDDIEVTPSTIQKYKNSVKGNRNIADDIVESKIKRNFLLGDVKNNSQKHLYSMYGNLKISAIKTEEGKYIINNIYNKRTSKWSTMDIDKGLKRKIEIILGLR